MYSGWIRSNVLGLMAIFIALGGTAIAAQTAGDGGKAQTAAKKKAKPGPRGPAGPAGPAGLTGPQGPPGPSTGPAGGDLTGTYPNPTIGPNAVGSAEVTDGSLGSADLGAASVDGDELGGVYAKADPVGAAVASGASAESTVTCDAGDRLLGGGFEWGTDSAAGDSVMVVYSSPSFVGDPATTWVARGRGIAESNTIFAEALCLNTA